MSGVTPKLAMEALARIYGVSKPALPTIEFGKRHERALRRIAELQADNTNHDRKVRENEKEITALSVKIAEIMGSHEHAAARFVRNRLFRITDTERYPLSMKNLLRGACWQTDMTLPAYRDFIGIWMGNGRLYQISAASLFR